MLNAMLGDKFSEVSMRRTTAGINFFRITTHKNKETEGSVDETSWSPNTEEPQDASSTLEEIIADNKVLRTANVIKERIFDIQLDEPLCEMRKDTALVIVDIPGLNEAGSSKMYMDYVSQQWDTFDCVIVVMDAEKGVNTEEQISLLKFVKKKQVTTNDVPVIVLCNKVDDPDHEEIAVLVDEVRAKVEEVFEVDCRKTALNKILNPSDSQGPTEGTGSFAFAGLSSQAPTSTNSHDEMMQTQPMTSFSFAAPAATTQPDAEVVHTSTAPSFAFTSSKPSHNTVAEQAEPEKLNSFGGPIATKHPDGEAVATSTAFSFSSASTKPSSDAVAEKADPGKLFCLGSPTVKSHFQAPRLKSRHRSFVKGRRQFRGSNLERVKPQESPAFIPISAENAFIYRTVSRLPLEAFEKLAKDIIDRLGIEEAGRMCWKTMSVEEKYCIVHAAVSNPSAYKQRLEATNFESLLKVLTHFLGGKDTQTKILMRQIDVATRRLRGTMRGIAGQLRSIYEMSKVVGKPTDDLKSQFWILYEIVEKDAFVSLQCNMSLDALHHCMDELVDYTKDQNKVLYTDGTAETSKAENARVVAKMKELVKRQYRTVVQERSKWKIEGSSFLATPGDVPRLYKGRTSHDNCRLPTGGKVSFTVVPGSQRPPESNPFFWTRGMPTATATSEHLWSNNVTGAVVTSTKNPDLPQPIWSNLSPDDWMTMANSILILVHEQHFSENFGPELSELELLKAEVVPFVQNSYMQIRKDYLSGEYFDGVFTPKDPTKYSLVRQIRIPESPADQEHWGHLAWKFCQFKKSVEERK